MSFKKLTGSWCSLESSLGCWVLNNILLNRFYDIELYTDSSGRELLLNSLGLDYVKVNNHFDDYVYSFPPSLWCYNKVHVYSVQKSPFLHIDGDVFIWQKFPNLFLDAQLCAQNLEVNLPNYVQCLKEISDSNFIINNDFFSFEKNKDVLASNAGVFGGSKVELFENLRDVAHDFLSTNLDKIDLVSTGYLNIMSEQLPVNKLADISGFEISYLLPPAKSPNFLSLNLFHNVYTDKGWYLHVMGAKKNVVTCENILMQLAYEDCDKFLKLLVFIYKDLTVFLSLLKKRYKGLWSKVCCMEFVSQIDFSIDMLPSSMKEDFRSIHFFVENLFLTRKKTVECWSIYDIVEYISRGPELVYELSCGLRENVIRLSEHFSIVKSNWHWFDSNDLTEYDVKEGIGGEQQPSEFFYAFFWCVLHCRLIPKMLDGLDLLLVSFLQEEKSVVWGEFSKEFRRYVGLVLDRNTLIGVTDLHIEERVRFFALCNWLEVGDSQ